MKRGLAAAAVMLLFFTTLAFAHRLDEFLQATTIAVEKDHVTLQMRLTPGVAVVPTVLAELDPDGSGSVSDASQRAYADRILRDLALTVDGNRLPLRIVSLSFPKTDDLKAGLGDIVLTLRAEVPGGGRTRKLVFENHYQRAIGAYLVNSLVPGDPDIRIAAQSRNYEQSFYQVDYTQAAGIERPQGPGTLEQHDEKSAAAPGRQSLFEAYFLHGVHHILTGYDHLLFISALVLAATTLWELVKVVSAFTLAHTITLTLAALNLVHLPASVVEPFISASIVFVAIQNVFWPTQSRGWSRLGAAFFFGLFHGLGFAGGLLDAMQELPGTALFLALLAFSIGVEAGHQMLVLPLFALLKAARQTQRDAATRLRLFLAFQRIGSAGISIAGAYYLCLALGAHS